MNDILPKATILGVLRLIDVYEYYDFPSLFLCRNASGLNYLALSVDEDESGESLTWLYLPVSGDRLKRICTGTISLHNAFKNAEDEFVFKVNTFWSKQRDTAEQVVCQDIDEEFLPAPEIKLSVHLPIGDTARRETINLIFNFKSGIQSTAPSKKLVDILEKIQILFNAAGKMLAEKHPEYKSRILDQTAMNIAAIMPGSFGIQLISNQEVKDDSDSLIGKAISYLYTLLEIGDNSELSSILDSGNIADKYSKFLNAINKSESDLSFQWFSPKRGYGGKTFLGKEQIPSIISMVEEFEKEEVKEKVFMPCELIGINARTRSFEIKNMETGKKYVGKIHKHAPPNVISSTISRHYMAELIKTKRINRPDTKWFLVELRHDMSKEYI